MLINILLIENNQDNLLYLQNFIDDLGIDNCQIVKEFVHVFKTINQTTPDLIICNPSMLSNDQKEYLSQKVNQLSTPLLWIITQQETNHTTINLKY